jgi:hypothetical protein
MRSAIALTILGIYVQGFISDASLAWLQSKGKRFIFLPSTIMPRVTTRGMAAAVSTVTL